MPTLSEALRATMAAVEIVAMAYVYRLRRGPPVASMASGLLLLALCIRGLLRLISSCSCR